MSNGDWPGEKVRSTFLEFFAGKSHRILPSFPLVPAQDPTLLFTAAGMAPFKAEFAGIAKPAAPRIATCQKCLRADDIGKVGRTSRHHTFFEMLGNFSFGDYFKQEAVEWAWDLLTRKYKLQEEKLWVSVHIQDDESYSIWRDRIKIPEKKLFRLADNFWGPIGPAGPCGPDSEIYYDRGTAFSCGKPDCRPGCENTTNNAEPCDRFLELWNLVFTMYHKDADGNLHDLPRKNIDTGAGLERLTMILQGADSPFETDLFRSTVSAVCPGCEKAPEKTRLAARIAADHVRAVTFMIADDVTPSNEGRGYVLQKILRRALLKQTEIPQSPPLFEAAFAVIRDLGKIYPELPEKEERIKFYIRRGMEDFRQILETADELLGQALECSPPNGGRKKVPGNLLFRFHDEKGFPYEFAKDFFESKGYDVDEAGFQAEMEKQRGRSRGTKPAADVMSQALKTQILSRPPTEFLGYEVTRSEGRVLDVFPESGAGAEVFLTQGKRGIVILDRSPFYGESGGQTGDTGDLVWENGKARVLDTQKNEGDVLLHYVEVMEGTLTQETRVETRVDEARREQIRRHHTATHLLHAALRSVLGDHVRQAGSYVSNEYLRLDFSHPQAVSLEELLRIEALVNEKISKNLPVQTMVTNPEEARKQGALAFFGEKYGDKVRVVRVNGFSRELCGGTHARATGELGLFVILKDSAVAKGIRRIEAKTGKAAANWLADLQRLRHFLTGRLKADTGEIPKQLDALLSDRQEKEKEIARLKKELAGRESESLLDKTQTLNGIRCLFQSVSGAEKGELRVMIDSLKSKLKSGIVFLASPGNGKISLACGITPDLTARGFSAVDLIQAACGIVGGGGGGRKDLAEAGGKDPARLQEAFQKLAQLIESKAAGGT